MSDFEKAEARRKELAVLRRQIQGLKTDMKALSAAMGQQRHALLRAANYLKSQDSTRAVEVLNEMRRLLPEDSLFQ